jgi:hypothetical protein
MTQPLQLLICQLTERSVSPDHIPGLMRNMLRLAGDGGIFTTTLVNTQLEQLGWGSEVLDETCFQLIVHILESEWGYRVRHYHSHSMEIITKTNWKN